MLSSTSTAVVEALKLKRKALPIRGSESPIARRTGDGSLEPLAHAEPVEQAIPAMSSASNNDWRSRPMNEMFDVFGSRGDSWPLMTISGRLASSVASKVSRSCGDPRDAFRRRWPATRRVQLMHPHGQCYRLGTGSQAGLLESPMQLGIRLASHVAKRARPIPTGP